MVNLKAENRDLAMKPKQLRRKGIIPGVVYGKDIENSLNVQFPQPEVERFLKSNSEGSKVELVIDGKKVSTLLREITYKPATSEIVHLSFQTLLAGETVTSTAKIVVLNREKIMGMVQQPIFEISYKALPAYLTETIEIDIEGLKIGDSIRISDLEIAKNPNIEILIPLDSMLISITESRKQNEALEDEVESETEKEHTPEA